MRTMRTDLQSASDAVDLLLGFVAEQLPRDAWLLRTNGEIVLASSVAGVAE